MTKRELIDDIMSLNPSAEPGFLAEFNAADLQRYLDKLIWLQEPRGDRARGFSPGQAPALRTEAVATALAERPEESSEPDEHIEDDIERVTGKWLPHGQVATDDEPGMAMLDVQPAEEEIEDARNPRQPQPAGTGSGDAWLF